MIKVLKSLFFLLSPREQRKALILLIMIFIMAFLDTIGVASILPFMAVLTNPQLIETNLILSKVFMISSIFGIKDSQQFVFALGVMVFVFLIISLLFKAFTTFFQYRFVQMRVHSIASRLTKSYLNQPYSWFLNNNSSDLGKNILSEVDLVIANGLNPLMELIARFMVTMALIVLLILADPKLAIIVGSLLGFSYSIIFYFVRKKLKKIGSDIVKNNKLRFLTINESFGAIKEIKLSGLETKYYDLFSKPSYIFSNAQASSLAIRQMPRFFLEALGFGGILLIMLYMISQTGTFNKALPIISLYVFAGYRMLPALQQIYGSVAQLTFISPAIKKLVDEIKNLKVIYQKDDHNLLSFEKSIKLKDIFFQYSKDLKPVLKNINIMIPAKSTAGFVGPTGSGKTTTVDLILGLLEPNKGFLEVDGKKITKENIRSWQRSIGYVPQHIYLADDTIASNIAFGIDYKDINQKTVENVSKISNLHDFILKELPDKYDTIIGERGVKLSGGQRQRIGIARALYNDPKILVLDEATSALDNQTEKYVMEAIHNLKKHITVIIIAHRLSTVKKCDQIFFLENGEITAKGKFNDLINSNQNFKHLNNII